jgi:hypothetical protein
MAELELISEDKLWQRVWNGSRSMKMGPGGLRALFWKGSLTRRWIGLFFLVFIYGTVAAASFNGFYQKWGFWQWDGSPQALADRQGEWGDERYSFEAMIDGTAGRPFVYRQFLPASANIVNWLMPDGLKRVIENRLQVHVWYERHPLIERLRISDEIRQHYLLRYFFIYYACVLFLLATMFVARRLCLELGAGRIAATIAPAVFAMSLEYVYSMGGFFYDFPYVFFMMAAVLLALRGRFFWLVPVTVLGTTNHETFFFFVPTLLPLLNTRYSFFKSIVMVAALTFLAGVTTLLIHIYYQHNPGAAFESWIPSSIRFYLDWKNLIRFEANYGVETPRAYSLFMFVLLAGVYCGAWPLLSRPLRRHIQLAAAINFPLVLVFCGAGEMRNFVLCFIGFQLALAAILGAWASTATGAAPNRLFDEAGKEGGTDPGPIRLGADIDFLKA